MNANIRPCIKYGAPLWGGGTQMAYGYAQGVIVFRLMGSVNLACLSVDTFIFKCTITALKTIPSAHLTSTGQRSISGY